MTEIAEIIEIATKKAYEIYLKNEQERKKRQKKEINQNTKKLLREFKRLQSHVENAVVNSAKDKPNDIQIILSELFDRNGYIKVQAIMESKERSQLIVDHIERMLKLYERECNEAGQLNYKVMEMYYFKRVKAEVIADEIHADISTVWRILRSAIQDMGVLLFGVMALDT